VLHNITTPLSPISSPDPPFCFLEKKCSTVVLLLSPIPLSPIPLMRPNLSPRLASLSLTIALTQPFLPSFPLQGYKEGRQQGSKARRGQVTGIGREEGMRGGGKPASPIPSSIASQESSKRTRSSLESDACIVASPRLYL
jgi:hypothetical protein